MSLDLSGSCCNSSGNLSLDLSLNGGCCEPPVRVVTLPGTVASRDLIRITSSDFASSTEWNGANSESVTITTRNSFKIFDNNVNRFLDEGTEWQRTSTGAEFLIPGFDSTTNSYTFYVHINQV